MLTKMTDADWVTVLRVFEASRSRRGDKGRDDKKFLSALHYFAVHNITWRALPAAVSGMMIPPAVLSSASMRLTTTRS
jgi:hypothetical protein